MKEELGLSLDLAWRCHTFEKLAWTLRKCKRFWWIFARRQPKVHPGPGSGARSDQDTNFFLAKTRRQNRFRVRFTQGRVLLRFRTWLFQTVRCANAMYSTASSSDRQISRFATRYHRNQRWNASTSQNANNAITMHRECEERVENHEGKLWNDKGQSATHKSCKVLWLRPSLLAN